MRKFFSGEQIPMQGYDDNLKFLQKQPGKKGEMLA